MACPGEKLLWEQKEPKDNWEVKERHEIEGSDIQLSVNAKRTRIRNRNDEYIYTLFITVYYKGCQLWPFSLFNRYLEDDKEIKNYGGYVSHTLFYKIDMQEDSIDDLLARAYKETCKICNANELWLYADMIQFLDKFDKYAVNGKNHHEFISFLSHIAKYCLLYGKKINPFFLETAKVRLLDYAYDTYDKAISLVNEKRHKGEEFSSIYRDADVIKEFIDASMSI